MPTMAVAAAVTVAELAAETAAEAAAETVAGKKISLIFVVTLSTVLSTCCYY